MMRSFATVVALTFALVSFGPAVAADKPAGEVKKTDEYGKPVEGAKSMKSMKTRRVDGVVKSAQADGIVVSGKEKSKERDWAFSVTEKTTIKRGPDTVMATDLKPGDAVTVNYTEQDGKVIAQSVTLKGAPTTSSKK